ncbi:MAG: M56 family metallopeptidase [Vulcanimicrobiaceae bacterium]
MNDLAMVVSQCLASGAIFSSLCAAIVVPPLAWLGVRALAPAIRSMNDDRPWQAALAAGAAALPGALFLALVAYGIAGGVNSACLQLVAGKALFVLLALLIAGAIARSLFRAHARKEELHWLLGPSTKARGRAGEIAAEVGVPLFQVHDSRAMLVITTGAPKPGVYISTGALRQFNDSELRAALFHERAHLDRGDHHIAPWLYFLSDLLPLPVGTLIDIYRCSREFCADRCALAHVERTDLASALLRVARGSSPSLVTSAAFAEQHAMYGRLNALLHPTEDPQPNTRRRRLVAIALSAILAIGLGLPAIAPFAFHCQLPRMGF